MQTFDTAAAALGEDCNRTLDGKLIRRWAETLEHRRLLRSG